MTIRLGPRGGKRVAIVLLLAALTGVACKSASSKSDVANAFALPGDCIFVTRGLLDEVDSDDELATVLAHECRHVAKKHAQKQIAENVAFLAAMAALHGGKYDKLRTGLYDRAAMRSKCGDGASIVDARSRAGNGGRR